jgi:hypothetical protein
MSGSFFMRARFGLIIQAERVQPYTLPATFICRATMKGDGEKNMAKKENYLPINAFYITALRDKRSINRPMAYWVNKETGEVIRQRNKMDSLDLLIYIMLLSRADKDKLTCYPSIETICTDCGGLNKRTAWEHLSMLEQMKFITITKSPGRPNIYFMADFAEWLKAPHY